jgi:plastocyanin domain-containing protein
MMRGIGSIVLILVGVAGCGKSTSSTAPSGTVPAAGQQVQVTSSGFVPGTIQASVAVPCTLMVTRATDMTCAREFVMPMYGIDQALPLNHPVQIMFTPTQAGNIPFSCQMGMVNGMVTVK